MYLIKTHYLNQLIIISTLLVSISYQKDIIKSSSLKTRTREGRNILNESNDELNDKSRNLSSLVAESRQDESRQDDDNQFGSKPYYSSRFNLNDLDDYHNLPSSSNNHFQPKSFEKRNSMSAPDFQANAAGFILPDYLANSASVSSSSSNLLNKLAPYESVPNSHSSLGEYGGYLNDKNNFVPSTSLRERRKGTSSYVDNSSSKSNNNNYNIYERQIDDQNQYEQLFAHKHHLLKNHNQGQLRDNEFASNSILESVSSPLDNQDFGLSNNYLSNDFGTSSAYNTELSALNNLAGLGGIRSFGALSGLSPSLSLNNPYNLSPLSPASSSLVGTLGGTLNGLGSVVPPGAIVGAPGSAPPPGMKLAGYVTVTNPAPNVGSMASPTTQQQMLLNQVMNRNPQAQALAQVMAQSMSQGIRIPFVNQLNPYTNNLQQLLASGSGLNGMTSSNSGTSSSNSNNNNGNSNNSNNENSNTNSNSNNASNGEQQVAASSNNRAKFLQRLNPLNLFRRLRTRNQKNNSKQNNKDQSNNSNEINNSIPDLEDRSQFFLPADFLLGSSSTTNQQQLPQLTVQQQQLAEQLSAQLAQLNMQLAQSNNKAKFLRKMGNGNNFVLSNLAPSTNAGAIKKVAKRDVTNQLSNNSSTEKQVKKETTSLNENRIRTKLNATSSNDTETAENGFFPVADLYQNYKFNLRPRFRFPGVREQRRISNVNGLHVNTNNFLTTSGSMKSNFVNLMGSRNFEGGILNNEGHRNTDHSMLHGMHSNNNDHKNHNLPHHHQNQRNLGHLLPNKGNKFNIDNDFDDDDEEDDDSMNQSGFNNGPIIGNTNNQRNGNNVMFLDDDLFANNGQGKNSMLGFQGFNSFNGNNQHFNALSSASSYSNQQMNNTNSLNESNKTDQSSESTVNQTLT